MVLYSSLTSAFLLIFCLSLALASPIELSKHSSHNNGDGDCDGDGDHQKRSTVSCEQIYNGCPNLDFSYIPKITGEMPYTMNVISVNWIGGITYELTINVVGQESIPLENLWELKILSITGPSSQVVLYSHNENVYDISDPTDYTATFEVYGSPDSTGKVWMPNIQIQYEYYVVSANNYYWNSSWGAKTIDLSVGCNNYNNYDQSQTTFPAYY